MKTITLIPGSAEWLQSRSASKAPAMMGCDPKTSRSELLRMMATGIGKEFTDWQQKNLLDKGHVSEAGARDIAEDILCDGLSPICCATDDDYLTAGPDGATFAGNIGFEAKAWNEKTAAFVRDGVVPDYHAWQLDQQILVCGFEYVLFMVTDGTREKCVSMEYRSTNERALALLAAWKQFDIDLAAYQHVESEPAAVAAPINELPALMVEITGSVTASNLVQWKKIVAERIAGINTDLQTDTDFANADAMVKFLDDGEKRIDLVKSQAQANAADIDRVFRALDEIKASMRAKRLELDKLVKARKEHIRGEIAREGLAKLNDHVDALNKRLGRKLIKQTGDYAGAAGDFVGAMKGKRTVSSLRDACDSELARAKIAASEQADRIQINLNAYADIAADHEFLFRDLDALVLKDADGFSAIVQQRISAHREQEAQRLEAERAKIRAQEEARAAAKVKAEQEAEAKRITDAAFDEIEAAERQRKATEPATQPAAPPTAAAIGGYTGAPAVVSAHTGVTVSDRLLDLLDDLARRMTESELSDLCIHAAHILSERKAAA